MAVKAKTILWWKRELEIVQSRVSMFQSIASTEQDRADKAHADLADAQVALAEVKSIYATMEQDNAE